MKKKKKEEEEAASISSGLKWSHLNTVLKSELGSSFRLKNSLIRRLRRQRWLIFLGSYLKSKHLEGLRNAALPSAATGDAHLIRFGVTGTNWTAETRWHLDDTIPSFFFFFWSTSSQLPSLPLTNSVMVRSIRKRIGDWAKSWNLLLGGMSLKWDRKWNYVVFSKVGCFDGKSSHPRFPVLRFAFFFFFASRFCHFSAARRNWT